MTDREKFNYIKQKLSEHILGIKTMGGFKAFLSNLNGQMIKDTLIARIQDDIDVYAGYETRISDLTEFKNEIDIL